MKIYRCISIFLYFYISIFLCADPVSVDMAEKVGRIQIEAKEKETVLKKAPPYKEYSITQIRELKDTKTEKTLSYILDLEPKGFIAVTPDTDITPVIAYSYTSNFSTENVKDNVLFHMLIKDLKNRLEAVPVTFEELKKENNVLWEKYLTEDGSVIKTLQKAQQWPADKDTGLLNTTWKQGDPYNYSCPMDPDTGKRTVVGCVATAMAQVINYWQWPQSISFTSADRYTTETRGIKIDTDYATLDFPSFDTLNERLKNIDYSGANTLMIADLCFACGIIVQMNYSSDASGALVFASHLKSDKLKYADAVDVEGDDASFYNLLQEDMKNARPALLAIYKDGYEDGHEIVADGYRDTGFYHLNFGWGATSPDDISEAWYSLPNGMPSNYTIIYGGVLRIIAPSSTSVSPYKTISYPNPFYPKKGEISKITIPEKLVAENTKIKIFNVSGQPVRTITSGWSRTYGWDGKNDDGDYVSTGLYLYYIELGGDSAKGKITLIK